MSGSRAPQVLAASLATLMLVVAGCAKFPDTGASPNWQERPEVGKQVEPVPPNQQAPGQAPGQRDTTKTSVPPPQGCKDFDPAVVATCLDPVSAVAVLPDGQAALAGLRTSGKIMIVQKDRDPVQQSVIPVDPAGDGGLTGLTPSPSYAEDELIYAYVTTPTDNRVIRIARGDTPKPVLTGIPRGTTGNRGSLAVDHSGALLVATGDAGNPAAAADPNSLAGKVLRINTTGGPAKGNPNPASAIIATGLHAPGGVCTSADGSATWITDRNPTEDVLLRLIPGQPLDAPAWRWSDHPGVAGCAAWPDLVMVATGQGAVIQNVPINRDGSVLNKPEAFMKDSYGRFGGVGLGPKGDYAWVGTVNKDGGKPGPSDDRVIIIPHPNGGGTGQD